MIVSNNCGSYISLAFDILNYFDFDVSLSCILTVIVLKIYKVWESMKKANIELQRMLDLEYFLMKINV